MSRDIEWLKDRILETQETYVAERDSYEPHSGGQRYCNGALSSISLILDLINQLDGSEVLSEEWLDENKSSWMMLKIDGFYIPVEKLQNLLVPKQELDVLSQEWIEGNTSPVDDEGRLYIWKRDLESLIIPKKEITEEQVMNWLDNNEFYDHITAEKVLERAVDKGELSYYGTKYSVIEAPTIPKYVADWIEAERGTMSNWKLPSGFISDSKYKKDQRRYKWSQVEGNMDKFMSALIIGYEVEKEKLYVVELSNDYLTNYLAYDLVYKVFFISQNQEEKLNKYKKRFTEKEIKDYDPRYWAFRKPVDKVDRGVESNE